MKLANMDCFVKTKAKGLLEFDVRIQFDNQRMIGFVLTNESSVAEVITRLHTTIAMIQKEIEIDAISRRIPTLDPDQHPYFNGSIPTLTKE